jgi:type II secretory pathway pseudopilin PulG
MKHGTLNRSEHGFALIAAIVLIVVLAAMAGFVASMVGGQSADQQLERMSGVADMAAQTGVEWGAYRVLNPVAAPPCPPGSTAPTGVLLPPLPGSLSAAQVRVRCARVTAVVTGEADIYQIISTATTASGSVNSPDYVERTKTEVFSR